PLRGKSFYLDLPSGRGARELAAAIGRLGGVTESFLSKEVSYVVSSNKEAKRDKARPRTEKQSNVTSEDAKPTSPMPSTSKGNHPRPHQKPPDTALISRGKELLQKAIKNQVSSVWMGFSLAGSILANARLWGVQILHVDGILLCRLKLSCWQPLLPQVPEQPALLSRGRGAGLSGSGLRAARFLTVSRFCRDSKPASSSVKEQNGVLSLKALSWLVLGQITCCLMHSEGEKSPRSTPITVPKKKRGFCECCQETFEELQKHLQSPQHKRFALDDSQYAPVDRVISQLANNF
ncbi:DBF4B protein, partial [Uria aalge]|nr:DBF4B protein [Uria aalge]